MTEPFASVMINTLIEKSKAEPATAGCPSAVPCLRESTLTMATTQETLTSAASSAANAAISKVALAGNPNVGKSVLFNALTGQYVEVSNFPGTTVSTPKGQWLDGLILQDTPGIYGLSALSEEERVAELQLLQADVVINVISGLTLERDLFLTQQLIDWGVRLLVVVNQLDEAQGRGLTLHLDVLQQKLGVPVLACVATSGQGVAAIAPALPKAAYGHKTPEWPADTQQARHLEQCPKERLILYGLRRQYINSVLTHVIERQADANAANHASHRWSRRLGHLLLHPLFGALALIGALLALYQIIGVWVAGDLVDLLEGQLLLGHVIPAIQGIIAQVVAPGTVPYTILAGEFGLITMSLQYILGVLLPLVLGFYLYLSVLEDCGYLPRLAVLADGLLMRMGLNGRAIIPMILGLGCVTMATISTRVLTSQRERTIANALLAITIPCSAQLGVIMGMAALAGGLRAWLVYMLIMSSIFVLLGSVLNLILPGKSSGLVLDLPPMRWPQLNNIVKKTATRTWSFMLEAAPLFVLGTGLVSFAQVTGLLGLLEKTLAPVTVKLLHLPAEAASAFIMGMVRRDFGLAGFNMLKDALSSEQILTSLIVITLFVPCIASATVMWKERGWLEGASVLLTSWVLAFTIGAVVSNLLRWLPLV